MKPTVSERMILRFDGRTKPRMVGIERREELILGEHLGAGQAVEQRRLAGVRVADERDHRERHAAARFAMEVARALHVFELALELRDAVADGATVGFDLRFTGTAQEAEAAALALQVGP